jgi:hypothetical protein
VAILLDDFINAQYNASNFWNDGETVTYERDKHAGIRILAFLARHHPEAEEEVLSKVLAHLPGICGLLGPDQGREQEACNPLPTEAICKRKHVLSGLIA